jgi:hypothetical protein
MKKYLVIMLSLITMHTHAMETENITETITPINLSKIPQELLDRIAQFLSFYDYETEEEFIERTKALTIKPLNCALYFSPKYLVCSPNNAIIAASEKAHFSKYDTVQSSEPSQPQICTIDRRTTQRKTYNNIIGNFHQKLAVSNCGNFIATIYTNHYYYPLSQKSTQQLTLNITSLPLNPNDQSNGDSYRNIPQSFKLCDKHPTIAFNKQGTDIIVHAKNIPNENAQHCIFPLSAHTRNPLADEKKTFAKYCAQRRICKNLMQQITAQK